MFWHSLFVFLGGVSWFIEFYITFLNTFVSEEEKSKTKPHTAHRTRIVSHHRLLSSPCCIPPLVCRSLHGLRRVRSLAPLVRLEESLLYGSYAPFYAGGVPRRCRLAGPVLMCTPV